MKWCDEMSMGMDDICRHVINYRKVDNCRKVALEETCIRLVQYLEAYCLQEQPEYAMQLIANCCSISVAPMVMHSIGIAVEYLSAWLLR